MVNGVGISETHRSADNSVLLARPPIVCCVGVRAITEPRYNLKKESLVWANWCHFRWHLQKMCKCFLHIQISLTTTLIFTVARFHHEHHHHHHRHHHDHDGTCETCALACWPADAARVLNWTSVWLSPDTCVVCSNNIIVLDPHCIILWRSTSEVIFWPEVSAWWVMGWGRLLTPEHLQEPEQCAVYLRFLKHWKTWQLCLFWFEICPQ